MKMNGAPNKNTVGNVGDVCLNTITNDKYECVAIYKIESDEKITLEYDWMLIPSQNSNEDTSPEGDSTSAGSIINVRDDSLLRVWVGTQAQYDSLLSKEDDVVYLIEDVDPQEPDTPGEVNIASYTIDLQLDSCINQNLSRNILGGWTYCDKITPVNDANLLISAVYMGGNDITEDVYNDVNGSILIPNVDGDIVLKFGPGIACQVGKSCDSLGNIIDDAKKALSDFIPIPTGMTTLKQKLPSYATDPTFVDPEATFFVVRCFDENKQILGSAAPGGIQYPTRTLIEGTAYIRCVIVADATASADMTDRHINSHKIIMFNDEFDFYKEYPLYPVGEPVAALYKFRLYRTYKYTTASGESATTTGLEGRPIHFESINTIPYTSETVTLNADLKAIIELVGTHYDSMLGNYITMNLLHVAFLNASEQYIGFDEKIVSANDESTEHTFTIRRNEGNTDEVAYIRIGYKTNGLGGFATTKANAVFDMITVAEVGE